MNTVFYTNGNKTVRVNEEFGSYNMPAIDAWVIKGQAMSPDEGLALVGVIRDSNPFGSTNYTPDKLFGIFNPWRIETHVGMSGAKDYKLRIRDERMEEEVGYPTSGKIAAHLHVSCARKLNEGIKGQLNYLFPMLMKETRGESVPEWKIWRPARYEGEWESPDDPDDYLPKPGLALEEEFEELPSLEDGAEEEVKYRH